MEMDSEVQEVGNNPWLTDSDDGICAYFSSLEKLKGNVNIDLPTFSDYSMADQTRLAPLPRVSHEIDGDGDSSMASFADDFDSLLEQYETNNRTEDVINRLEILNKYPNALKKDALDVLKAAIGRIIGVVEFLVDRQSELCLRLTLDMAESSDIESIPVHADDQPEVIKSFTQIVSFINKLKDHLSKAQLFPRLCEQLEEKISTLVPTEESLLLLQKEMDEIEKARSILTSITSSKHTLR